MKIDKRLYKYIEYEMYHYKDYKKEIQSMREEILEGSPSPSDGQPKGTTAGNPTENKAIKLSMSVGYAAMEKTVKGIDNALSLLSERHRKIFDMIYIKHRKDRYSMSDELFISYDTLNRNKNELVKTVGKEIGVIKAF